MESSWRLGVADAGLQDWGIGVNEQNERIPLCARLITPLLGPAGLEYWVCQYFAANQWFYFTTTGFVQGSIPWFSFQGYGARPFDPPFPVYPD